MTTASAAIMAECFSSMLTTGPNSHTRVPVFASDHVQHFFDELGEAIGSGEAIHRDTYEFAMKAIKKAYEGTVVLEQELSIEDWEIELGKLAMLYEAIMDGQVEFSDEEFEGVLRLTAFLKELGTIYALTLH